MLQQSDGAPRKGEQCDKEQLTDRGHTVACF